VLCARNDRGNLLDGGRPRDGAPKSDSLQLEQQAQFPNLSFT
jgi:hypothetical protein